MSLATILLGPLAGVECRRAVARGWVIWVRTLAAGSLLVVTLVVLWIWWFSQKFDPDFLPFEVLRGGLVTLEGIALTVALVMAPAVLAGSLAGEKERGALGLLLTTQVSSREIVTGRLAGKVSQVAMIVLAGLPAVVLLAALAGLGVEPFLLAIGLPLAVALGGGGLALAASAVARRGRDALLTVYFLVLVFLLGPLFNQGLPPSATGPVLNALNPYHCLVPLLWWEQFRPAWQTIGLWSTLGLLGTALAAWRLRPSCLKQIGGASNRLRRGRRGWVPPLDENRPMLWKELFIERANSLGWFGKVMGIVLLLWLGAGSTIAAAVLAAQRFAGFPATSPAAEDFLHDWIADPAVLVGWLIQWAIGLRAAVAIASERERNTWDSLLTTLLDGREIVVGKVWGSLYALRWLILAALWAWTLALSFGAMRVIDYVSQLASVLVIGAFMAAVGVRTSLATASVTRAMSITIGAWLLAGGVLAIVSGMILGIIALLIVLLWLMLAQTGVVSWQAGPWFPMSGEAGYALIRFGLYGLATMMIVADTRLRFDRLAGRMTAGTVAVAVDRFFHGTPIKPVPLSGRADGHSAVLDRTDRRIEEPVAHREGAGETPRSASEPL